MRVFWIILICLCLVGCMNPQNVAVDEYDVSELSSDFGGDEAYKIGATKDGKPVFVDPDAAFKQVVIDYQEDETMQEEYYLFQFQIKLAILWILWLAVNS